MSTISKVIVKNPGLRDLILSDPPTYHCGPAKRIVKMNFPISGTNAELLFAAISVDGSLPQKRRRTEEVMETNDEVVDMTVEEEDEWLANPAKKVCTVTGQTYQNYKSSLRWWHTYENPAWDKEGFEWPADVGCDLQLQIQGYKKDVGSKKREGVMQKKEGKSKYSTFGYVQICKYFNSLRPSGKENTWREGLFSASFTKTSTATIGRSDNINDIATVNIDARNDSLNYTFDTTKSDQAGESTSDVKRIFANPFMPEICLHLDFIVNVMCRHPNSALDAQYLFGGSDQHKRYYKCLRKAMSDIDHGLDLGCHRGDIGTHSNRKWAESMAVSRVDGPSRNQVCLRAGQSVGRVQDCYMKQEDDGDALTGRTLALLKINADEFDVLPPHFSHAVDAKLESHGWDDIIPGYNHYPDSFQRAIRLTFPSLVYHFHSGKLSEIYLSEDHPLWRVRLFTHRELLDSLKDEVLITFGHCPFTNMYAEGIPALVQVCREVRQESKQIRKDIEILTDKLVSYMEKNDCRWDVFRDDFPRKVVDVLLRDVSIDGAVPLTRDSMRDVVKDLLEDDNGKLTQIILNQKMLEEKIAHVSSGAQPRSLCSSDENSITHPTAAFSGEYTGEYHLWRGVDCHFHRVYAGFTWPSDCAFTMWELWWRGDAHKKVCPYRYINSNRDLVTMRCKARRSKTKKVMTKLLEIAIDCGLIDSSKDINYDNSTTVFDNAYQVLIDLLYGDEVNKGRSSETSVSTLAHRLYKLPT